MFNHEERQKTVLAKSELRPTTVQVKIIKQLKRWMMLKFRLERTKKLT